MLYWAWPGGSCAKSGMRKSREWSIYFLCGGLVGYWLSATLFFDNRLPLTSSFFAKLSLTFILVYGGIALLLGGLTWLVHTGLVKTLGANVPWSQADARSVRMMFCGGVGIFITLFFWHFDSFYHYATFDFTLLFKRLLFESFNPFTLMGIGNLAHLAGLLGVSAVLVWLVVRLRLFLRSQNYTVMPRVGIALIILAPWLAELALAYGTPEGPQLRARPGRKVLIIGVDALDWKYANQYLQEGELPALKTLAQAGVFSPLETFQPAYSPMVWTTIATGRQVAEHNIRHFTAYSFNSTAAIQPLVEPSLLLGNPYALRLMSQAGLLQAKSVTGNTRHVPAFWDISSQAGLSTAVLGWWASSPAEKIAGVMVGDYATHTDLSPTALRPHVYPAEMAGQVGLDLTVGRQLPAPWLDRLFALTPGEKIDFSTAGEPVIMREVKRSLAHDYGLFGMARRLITAEQPDVLAVFLEGIDTVGHMALHFERTTDATSLDSVEVRQYRNVNRAYYQIVDEMIGELVALVDEETYVFVLSDHGFELQEEPNYFHHKTGPPGLLAMIGPAIVKQTSGQVPAHIFDIAPTLLYALGLPVAEDMSGRVLVDGFSAAIKERYPVEKIASYDELRSGRHQGGQMQAASDGASQSAVQRLKALGYIE